MKEHVTHYRIERNHPGLDNQLIIPVEEQTPDGVIDCWEWLCGVLKHYRRLAA